MTDPRETCSQCGVKGADGTPDRGMFCDGKQHFVVLDPETVEVVEECDCHEEQNQPDELEAAGAYREQREGEWE